jgi:hypothetical protein
MEAQYNMRMSPYIITSFIDRAIAQMAENGCDKWIERINDIISIIDGQPAQVLMDNCYNTVHDLLDLGLVEVKYGIAVSRYFNLPVIDRIRPTNLGVCIMKACEYRKYTWFNKYVQQSIFVEDMGDTDSVEIFEKVMDFIDKGLDTFLSPFLSCFPKSSVDLSSINTILFEQDEVNFESRVFDFKVSLGKKCYRILRCLPDHTFEQLHLAIQKAFNFADDHLYSFFLDGKRFSYNVINSPHGMEPPYSHEVLISDARLRPKQRILYLFDYGDEWQFDVTVYVNEDADRKLKKPKIIESVGKAPEQYPDYEEDGDND